jgi:hypothetical protein
MAGAGCNEAGTAAACSNEEPECNDHDGERAPKPQAMEPTAHRALRESRVGTISSRPFFGRVTYDPLRTYALNLGRAGPTGISGYLCAHHLARESALGQSASVNGAKQPVVYGGPVAVFGALRRNVLGASVLGTLDTRV